MPTLQKMRDRMIEVHNNHPGVSMRKVHNQVMPEVGYTFPLRYIQDKIHVISDNGLLR